MYVCVCVCMNVCVCVCACLCLCLCVSVCVSLHEEGIGLFPLVWLLLFRAIQTLKLQEAPEDVPTGEMPRQVLLSVDRCAFHCSFFDTRFLSPCASPFPSPFPLIFFLLSFLYPLHLHTDHLNVRIWHSSLVDWHAITSIQIKQRGRSRCSAQGRRWIKPISNTPLCASFVPFMACMW